MRISSILIALLFTVTGFAQSVYYVTTTGNSGNNGLSEGNAWNFAHAIAQAQAGDTVHIKAGNYGELKLQQTNNGTASAPIVFMGYTTTIKDITATTGPTYDYADFLADNSGLIETANSPGSPTPNTFELPDNIMPHLEYNLHTNSEGYNCPEQGDTALRIDGDYVEFHNLMISKYDIGISMITLNDYVTLDNIIINQAGCYDPSLPGWNENYMSPSSNPPNDQIRTGYGIATAFVQPNQSSYQLAPTQATRFTGHVWKNCMVVDGGLAVYFLIDMWQATIENCVGVGRQPGNGPDYIFDGFGFQEGLIKNCIADRRYKRDGGNSSWGHFSRGYILQACSDGNTIDGFTAYNVNTQVENANNNIIKNVRSIGDTDSFAENDGQLQVNASHDNVFINNEYSGGGPFISVMTKGFNERENIRPTQITSDNNYFVNFIGHNTANQSAGVAFSFHRFMPQTNDAIHGNNYVINSTFDDHGAIINANKRGTVYFYNTAFVNSDNSQIDRASTSDPWVDWSCCYNAFYINCLFNGNAYSTPSGTNIQTGAPLFTDAANNDFTIGNVSSPLVDNGMDASTITPYAAVDFAGNARSGTYDIGAYEFGSSPPTPTCSDGIQNGDETGVDCGGSCPNPCDTPDPPGTPLPNRKAAFYRIFYDH